MNRCSILKTYKELQTWLNNQSLKICFVPTMGGLHPGHGELIRQATVFQGKIVVSIFINPLQFSASEDYAKYPRSLEKDAELAYRYGADVIWAPSVQEIFPKGIDNHFKIKAPKSLKANLCGSNRKGHFDGVATIIIYLLQSIKPDILILGEKDWQQFIIIRTLISDLRLPIKLKGVATVRDQDGLALSSRNKYLNDNKKKAALALPQELQKAAKDNKQGKKINLDKIALELNRSGLEVEYLEVVDPYKMQLIDINKNLCLLAAAVRCGETRLIDHVFLMNKNPIIAIDGPAGAGKSTVTKCLAKQLGLTYLDTGAMYRAVTLLIKQNNIDPKNHIHVREVIETLSLNFQKSSDGEQKVIMNGNEVTQEIRSPEVTNFVSKVAAELPVREFLTTQQQEMGKKGGLVAEGRDIGSTVFPNAELKIFLTASTAERAKRRSNDLKLKGFPVPDFATLEQEIISRDEMDSSRELSPLRKADDAIEVITDGMNIDEVITTLIDLFRLKIPEEVWPSPF